MRERERVRLGFNGQKDEHNNHDSTYEYAIIRSEPFCGGGGVSGWMQNLFRYVMHFFCFIFTICM